MRALLDAAGVAYEIDSTLVRGLDYYTRTVFEFTSDALGAQSGVGGGGRYDRLVEQLGGPPTPGMGWAAGIERILLAGEAQPAPPPPVELFIALEDEPARARPPSRCSARPARPASRAQMELGRALAERPARPRRLARRALRRDRRTARRRRCKDMQDGGQERIPTDTVVHAVLRGLRTL